MDGSTGMGCGRGINEQGRMRARPRPKGRLPKQRGDGDGGIVFWDRNERSVLFFFVFFFFFFFSHGFYSLGGGDLGSQWWVWRWGGGPESGCGQSQRVVAVSHEQVYNISGQVPDESTTGTGST